MCGWGREPRKVTCSLGISLRSPRKGRGWGQGRWAQPFRSSTRLSPSFSELPLTIIALFKEPFLLLLPGISGQLPGREGRQEKATLQHLGPWSEAMAE